MNGDNRVLPILFNTDMVRAILEEEPYNKTATRRKINGFIPDDAIWGYTAFAPRDYRSCRGTFADGYGEKFFRLPYLEGDILYVRETFRPLSDHPAAGFEYAADWSAKYFANSKRSNCCNHGKWIPSIHMPKRAARIWLKVKDVSVERLHNMTLKDFLAEGITVRPETLNDPENAYQQAKNRFIAIWDSTIPKEEQAIYSWDANPWVWVIEFEQCEKPEACTGNENREEKEI